MAEGGAGPSKKAKLSEEVPQLPATLPKKYLFHVLYQGAYESPVAEGTCTKFCDKILLGCSRQTPDKLFFYPKRDNNEYAFQDIFTSFNTVLTSSDKSLILISSEANFNDNFYRELLRRSVDSRAGTPVFSVNLGNTRPISLLNPVDINKISVTADTGNWMSETEKINNLFCQLFDKNDISITVSEISLPQDDLQQIHRNNIESIKERDAFARWLSHFNLRDEVRKELERLGADCKDGIIMLLDDFESFRTEHNFFLSPVSMKMFNQAAEAIKQGHYTWREDLDEHILKSKQWHLFTTVRLKAVRDEQELEHFRINNISAFIEALSYEIDHPRHNLFLHNQAPGSVIITFIAKCQDFDDIEGLQKRLTAKVFKFEEPFCVLEKEHVNFFPAKSHETDRPPIVSHMMDISEEYDHVLFHSNVDNQPNEMLSTGDWSYVTLFENLQLEDNLEVDKSNEEDRYKHYWRLLEYKKLYDNS